MDTAGLAEQYVRDWVGKCYCGDIPDEVPHELDKAGVAPSYKAIAIAILKNDMGLSSLGFSRPTSVWYSVLKGIELAGECEPDPQMVLRFPT